MKVLILIYHFCPYPLHHCLTFFFLRFFIYLLATNYVVFTVVPLLKQNGTITAYCCDGTKTKQLLIFTPFFFFLAYLTDIHFWFSMWRETLKRQRFGRPIEIFVCPMPPPMQAILFIVLHFYSYILTFSFIIQTNFNSQGNAWNHYYPFCFLGCWITLSLFCFFVFFFQKSWNWYLLCYQFVNVAAKNLT